VEGERILMNNALSLLKIILFFFVVNTFAFAQCKTELFPSSLNVKPFTANTLEPNLGFQFKMNSNELLLNIANSMDIIHLEKDNEVFSAGADLFTWTLLRKEGNFHFPVDAVDYLFGINFGYVQALENSSFGARVRISHISAHFVDGHYGNSVSADVWNGILQARVYSREFIEVLPFYKWNDLRVYGGFTYLYHVDPSTVKKDNYQIGFDYYLTNYINDYITPFVGYDFKIDHVDQYTGNNSLAIGVKIGKADGRGLSLAYRYYSGNSLHGEYYNYGYYEKFSSFSLNLDL
jgi:hypothetical protein